MQESLRRTCRFKSFDIPRRAEVETPQVQEDNKQRNDGDEDERDDTGSDCNNANILKEQLQKTKEELRKIKILSKKFESGEVNVISSGSLCQKSIPKEMVNGSHLIDVHKGDG